MMFVISHDNMFTLELAFLLDVAGGEERPFCPKQDFSSESVAECEGGEAGTGLMNRREAPSMARIYLLRSKYVNMIS